MKTIGHSSGIMRLLLLGALVGSCGGSGPTPIPGALDKLVSNIAYACSSDPPGWCSALVIKNGQPYVELISGDAYVHFGPIIQSASDAACPAIAAIANDGNTGLPLGLTSIVVMAGANIGAHCYPPQP